MSLKLTSLDLTFFGGGGIWEVQLMESLDKQTTEMFHVFVISISVALQ
jgi:hypothetical protein